MVLSYFEEEKEKDSRTIVRNWDKIVPSVLQRLNTNQTSFKYFGVYDGEKIVGFVNILFPASDKELDMGEILLTYLLPEYHDADGKNENFIFQWAISKLQSLSAKRIRTDILMADEKAIAIARQNNFKIFRAICTLDL